MGSEGIVSTLAEQMLEAKARAEKARVDGRDARLIESIDRGIRKTLACVAQLRDPREVAMKGFSLLVRSTGELVIRHHEWELPVSSQRLNDLLGEAGLRPKAGQILLLDAVIVLLLVEEALGANGLREIEVRESKSRLLKASLDAEAQERVDGHRVTGSPPEAA